MNCHEKILSRREPPATCQKSRPWVQPVAFIQIGGEAQRADQKAKADAEKIIGKLREVESVLAPGGTTDKPCRRISITEQTYYRWGEEYGGLKRIRRAG